MLLPPTGQRIVAARSMPAAPVPLHRVRFKEPSGERMPNLSRKREAGHEDAVVLVEPLGADLDVDPPLRSVGSHHRNHEWHTEEVVAAMGGVEGGAGDVGLVITSRNHHKHSASHQLIRAVVTK